MQSSADMSWDRFVTSKAQGSNSWILHCGLENSERAIKVLETCYFGKEIPYKKYPCSKKHVY